MYYTSADIQANVVYCSRLRLRVPGNENGLVSLTGNYKNTTIDLFWPSMKYSVCTCVIKSVELLEQSCEGYRHPECLDACWWAQKAG